MCVRPTPRTPVPGRSPRQSLPILRLSARLPSQETSLKNRTLLLHDTTKGREEGFDPLLPSAPRSPSYPPPPAFSRQTCGSFTGSRVVVFSTNLKIPVESEKKTSNPYVKTHLFSFPFFGHPTTVSPVSLLFSGVTPTGKGPSGPCPDGSPSPSGLCPQHPLNWWSRVRDLPPHSQLGSRSGTVVRTPGRLPRYYPTRFLGLPSTGCLLSRSLTLESLPWLGSGVIGGRSGKSG